MIILSYLRCCKSAMTDTNNQVFDEDIMYKVFPLYERQSSDFPSAFLEIENVDFSNSLTNVNDSAQETFRYEDRDYNFGLLEENQTFLNFGQGGKMQCDLNFNENSELNNSDTSANFISRDDYNTGVIYENLFFNNECNNRDVIKISEDLSMTHIQDLNIQDLNIQDLNIQVAFPDRSVENKVIPIRKESYIHEVLHNRDTSVFTEINNTNELSHQSSSFSSSESSFEDTIYLASNQLELNSHEAQNDMEYDKCSSESIRQADFESISDLSSESRTWKTENKLRTLKNTETAPVELSMRKPSIIRTPRFFILIRKFIKDSMDVCNIKTKSRNETFCQSNLAFKRLEVIEDIKKMVSHLTDHKLTYKFMERIKRYTKKTADYKYLKNLFDPIKRREIVKRLDSSSLFKITKLVESVHVKLRYWHDKKIGILQYYIFNQLCKLEENVITKCVHMAFLYNVGLDNSKVSIRSYISIIFFMKAYYKGGKMIKLKKSEYLYLLAFLLKNFKSSKRTGLLTQNSPMVKYFYRLHKRVLRGGEEYLISSFMGMLIPEKLFNEELVVFKKDLQLFIKTVRFDKHKVEASKDALLASTIIFKKNKNRIKL